jgi:hypothetical protein
MHIKLCDFIFKAKQLIKPNKNSNILVSSFKSFDSTSYDSGIDNSSSSINYSSKNNQPKISISSSSCSFNEDSSVTPSSIFSIPLSNLENIDQVYSAPISFNLSDSSSSKNSSYNYLISPTDESGYLIPINLINNFNKKITKPQSRVKNTTNIQLTRSFSTRSAYQSAINNSTVESLSYGNHRATICEQLTNEDNFNENIEYIDDQDKKIIFNEYCIKCSGKLIETENSRVNHFIFYLNNEKSLNL